MKTPKKPPNLGVIWEQIKDDSELIDNILGKRFPPSIEGK